MKPTVVILGVFCLLISAYPCCPMDDCQKDGIENKQTEAECGLCSPFINCGSCTGFVQNLIRVSSIFVFQLPVSSNAFGVHHSYIEAEYTDRVWQPPKLVIIS